MQLSTAWLKADFGLEEDARELASRLTMAGLEVDGIHKAAADFSGVIIGEVAALEAHPDADKLRVAKVNVGQDAPLQIVCGAPNVAQGVRVPVAMLGAVLPLEDGVLKIKKSKLRGVESSGMLCSARELGMSDDHSGLLILPADAPIGADIRSYLQLDDSIIDVDLTPNRADAFSMRGLAREAALLFGKTARYAEITAVPASIDAAAAISCQAPADCPKYLARVIENVDNTAATPLWMAERLRRAGIRTHDPLVDITNYVMLLLGTPMHAFDKSKIHGGIVIRRARQGEKLHLINDSTAVLDDDVLIIADAQRPLAIAGVMGGLDSGCSTATTAVVLEAAWFSPVTIAGKARRFGLSSDSAQRFERGVDFTLQEQALELATQLILDICGGQAGAAASSIAPDALPRRTPIVLPAGAIGKRIGRDDYAPADVAAIFQSLGCAVQTAADSWTVTPPPWRFDMECAEDLIEEIARVDGYANIPDRLPAAAYQKAGSRPVENRLADSFAALGFQEAITYSFIDRASQAAYFGDAPAICLQNPISAELAEMRLSLIPGLVNTLIYNRNRQQANVRLFEIGKTFTPNGSKAADAIQTETAAAVLCGLASPEQWGTAARPVDFYDVKGIAETLLAGEAVVYQRSQKPWLHPGLSADISKDGRHIGCLGCLHPAVLKTLGAKGGDVWVLEIRTDALPAAVTPRFAAIGRYPAVRRDLALITDITTPAAEIERVIRAAGGEKLREILFFDQYQGNHLPKGKRSLAVGIILQDSEKTLQDEEVEGIIAHLVETLGRDCGTELR